MRTIANKGDEFYSGIWWVKESNDPPMLRDATPKECAREIKKLREKIDELREQIREKDEQIAKYFNRYQ